jgi:hypothetical protein
MLEFRVCSTILLEMPTPLAATPQIRGWIAVALYGGAQ